MVLTESTITPTTTRLPAGPNCRVGSILRHADDVDGQGATRAPGRYAAGGTFGRNCTVVSARRHHSSEVSEMKGVREGNERLDFTDHECTPSNVQGYRRHTREEKLVARKIPMGREIEGKMSFEVLLTLLLVVSARCCSLQPLQFQPTKRNFFLETQEDRLQGWVIVVVSERSFYGAKWNLDTRLQGGGRGRGTRTVSYRDHCSDHLASGNERTCSA